MLPAIVSRVALMANPGQIALAPLDLTRLSGAQMKGFSLIQLFDAVTAELGPEVVDAWRSSLPEPLRAQVERRAVSSVGWLPMELYYHLVAFVVQSKLDGDHRRALDLGASVASREISAFFRMVLGFTTPAMVFSLTGRVWRTYFDRGELAVLESKAGYVQTEVRGWPLNDVVSIHELVGSFVQWIEASRGKGARISRFEALAPGKYRLDAEW